MTSKIYFTAVRQYNQYKEGERMDIYQKLWEIQQKIKVPKTQWNEFSKFRYRNMDDIIQALKPLMMQYQVMLLMSDNIKEVNGKNYLEATVTLVDLESGDKIAVNGFAREAEKKTGMDDAQVTGTCSSYARKYALAGLLCLDNDGNDPDAMDNRGASNNQQGKPNNPPKGQNTSQSSKNSNKRGILSDAQLNRLNMKMKAAHMKPEDVTKWVQKKFGKNDVYSLRYEEYDSLCNALDLAVKKQQQQGVNHE